jgi:hypothetical protein
VDKAWYDRMVGLVTQMLGLNKRLQDASLDRENFENQTIIFLSFYRHKAT